jgi:hydroxymethylpyrimidine/phosphomethylpyrimidine kinase
MKHVLTIAGSDSSGGAGIQADLKTFAAHGVYGMSVITAVTAQNTSTIMGIQNISSEIIIKQLEAIFSDIRVDAVKIGMLSNAKTILAVVSQLAQSRPPHIVLDTVMISKSGHNLLDHDAVSCIIEKLAPLSSILTPNIPEAQKITGQSIHTVRDMETAAVKIYEKIGTSVLIKGGHLASAPTDVLFDRHQFFYFESIRVETKNTHGTGCTLASAIAANLAQNISLPAAVAKAKRYVNNCILNSLDIGKGAGPLHHFYFLNPPDKETS